MALSLCFRRILCFCSLYFISCDMVSAESCLKSGLTDGGGSASAVNGDNVLGCIANCSSPESQTHVIRRYGTSFANETKVFIENTCDVPVDVILVLLSDVYTNWTLNLSHPKTNINIQRVHVNMTNCANNGLSSLGTQGICFNFSQSYMIPFETGNITQITLLMKLFEDITKTPVVSINQGKGLAMWNLKVGKPCCPDSPDSSAMSLTPTTPIETPSPASSNSIISTMTMSEQDSSISSTGGTSTLIAQGGQTSSPPPVSTSTSPSPTGSNDEKIKSGGDNKSADNLPIVIGLVVLSVVLLSLSIGFGCCIFCHKKKAALVRGSTQAEPNIYVESPNTPESNDNGVTRDEPAPDEVEYEEAATVIPPVRPPRNIQP